MTMDENRTREFLQQIEPVVREMNQLSWELRERGADYDEAMGYEFASCWDWSYVVFEVMYRGAGAVWTAVVGSKGWRAGSGASPEEALQDAERDILSTRDKLSALLDTFIVHDA